MTLRMVGEKHQKNTQKLKNKSIAIMGIGAIGSNLTCCLVSDLRGKFNITVLDYDKIEQRNVQAGTQFYMRDQIGMSKVEALQYNVYKWYGRKIDILDKKVEKHNAQALMRNYDLVIDCFDNFEGRAAIQLHHPVATILHVGFSDQFTFAIEWSENYDVPSDSTSGWDICEAQGAASWIKMIGGLASLVIQEFISNTEKLEFVGNKFTIRQIT